MMGEALAVEVVSNLSARAITGMLMPATQAWTVGTSGADPQRVTQADAAGMVAAISGRLEAAVFYIVDKDDWINAERTETQLYLEVCDWARAEGWKIPPGDQIIRRMVCMALLEHVHPTMWRTASARALCLGRCRANWYRTWNARYDRIYHWIGTMLAWARWQMRRG